MVFAKIQSTNTRNEKLFDLGLLITYFIGIILTTTLGGVHTTAIVGAFLFFMVPGFYIVIRNWSIHKEAFIFSVIVGLACGIVMEIIGQVNHLWDYPITKFLNLDALQYHGYEFQAVLWYVAWFWFTVIIYRAFFDPDRHLPNKKSLWKNHKKFLVLSLGIVFVFTLFFAMIPEVISTQYAYLKMGSFIIVIPILYACIKHPRLIPGIVKLGLSMSLFLLAYEIFGLRLGHWVYTGSFIAEVRLLGAIFPLEELILWVLLGSMFVAALYEEFELNLG